MRLLDTNVLLRWLLDDDPVQSPAADRFIKSALREGSALLVADLSVAEMVWVLEGRGVEPPDIAIALRGLLERPGMGFENHQRLLTALALFEAHAVDFIDAYQAAVVQERDLEAVVSFDRDFDRLPVSRVEP